MAAYYVAPKRGRHLVLTAGSYFFYAWWNPWFVFLMLISTTVDFFCGKKIHSNKSSKTIRKSWVLVSVTVNLGILAFFKYAGFFSQNVSVLAKALGLGEVTLPPIFNEIVLPVGISFYTF